MLKNLLCILVVCHIVYDALAQKPYYRQQSNFVNANKIWAFYAKEGLSFNAGVPPVPITTSLSGSLAGGQEGCASVCDPVTGELLFYSSGANVWDKNGQVMPNGTGLLGNSWASSGQRTLITSTSQGVCIVPFIDVPGKYYIFSLMSSGALETQGSNKDSIAAFYNVVDMNLNSNLGDIVGNQKNIPLTPHRMRYAEAMIAVPGNCNDIWLLLHRKDSAVYDAYRITKEGVNPIPVTSRTNGPKNASALDFYNYGQMAISPDRTKLAYCAGSWFASFPFGGYGAIAAFDANTGTVSNEIILGGISNNPDTAYRFVGVGAAFSPDGKKFYAYELKDQGIVQYDVSVHNYDSINLSRQVIAAPKTISPLLGHLRLYGDSIYYAGTGYINIIANPNNTGVACNYIHEAIKLSGTSSAAMTLPTEVVYPVKDSFFTLRLDTVFCQPDNYDGLTLSPSEQDSKLKYIWNDASFGSTLNITESGTYWVAYVNGCDHYVVDSFKVEALEIIQPTITINVGQLGTHIPYASYQWMLNDTLIIGATLSTYPVKVNGYYKVIVTNSNGCTDTSEVYQVTNADETNIRGLELAKQIKIYPNPANETINISASIAINAHLVSIDGRILKTFQNSRSISVSQLSPGVYQLRIYNTSGALLTVEKIIKIAL